MPVGNTIDDLTKNMPATVLVVDDEASVRDLVTRWLTQAGYRCASAGSIRDARDYFHANEVHLVTLDVRMAGRSGIDLLHHINEISPDTSVIMMTGVSEAQTAIEALTYGACAYLIKPIVCEELVFHARRAVERRQLIIEKREHIYKLEERVREQTVAIRRAHEETIYRLVSASQWRSEETGMHIKRTGLLSELLAKAAGWPPTDAEDIRLAAPMHDIGKIGISDAILLKPGKLTPQEFEIMKTHTVIGARILAGSNVPMLQMAQEIAQNHHEHWDGGGYPAGLAGQAIPECARILAIVDVFDSLTHDRVYRPAFSEEQTLAFMQQGAGTQFDPLLLALFFSHLDEITLAVQGNPDDLAPEDFLGQLLPSACPGKEMPEHAILMR